MIWIVGRYEKLSADNIVGKYVLRDLGFHWPAFGQPVVAVSCSGSRVYVERERPVWDQEGKEWFYTGEGEREPDGYMSISSVRCLCDTADDVNMVLETSRMAATEFKALIERAGNAMQALHGVSASPVPRQP